MKFNLLRFATMAGAALVGSKALLWLVSPPPWTLLPVPKEVVILHSWNAAKMRRHIHAGMVDTQVHRLLGKPSEEDSEAMPGDIPNVVDDQEGYYTQGGALFVYYRLSPRGEVVVDTSRK